MYLCMYIPPTQPSSAFHLLASLSKHKLTVTQRKRLHLNPNSDTILRLRWNASETLTAFSQSVLSVARADGSELPEALILALANSVCRKPA